MAAICSSDRADEFERGEWRRGYRPGHPSVSGSRLSTDAKVMDPAGILNLVHVEETRAHPKVDAAVAWTAHDSESEEFRVEVCGPFDVANRERHMIDGSPLRARRGLD
jgi:hypothetical protein